MGLAISILDSRGQHELEDAELPTQAEGSSLIERGSTLWGLRGKG